MATFIIKKHINAQPALVFQLASDVTHAAQYVEGIEKVDLLTDGPIGVGTRFAETRVLLGKESTEELEFTQFDPPHGYVVECESCGMHYRSAFHFVADIAGTHVRVEIEARPRSWLAKMLYPLTRFLLRPMLACIERDLDDLKVVAEGKAKELRHAESQLH